MASKSLAELAFDLANPPLDTAVQRLVSQHGAVKVRDAVKRLTTLKKGRKPEKDWQELAPWITQDANDWLDGLDPLSLRTNYFLAKQVAMIAPGHNAVATHRRVMGKLAKKRLLFMHITAWQVAESERPFNDYFRACQALASVHLSWGQYVISLSDNNRGKLERYRANFGEPDPAMTMAEIATTMDAMPLNALLKPPRLGLLEMGIAKALEHAPSPKSMVSK